MCQLPPGTIQDLEIKSIDQEEHGKDSPASRFP